MDDLQPSSGPLQRGQISHHSVECTSYDFVALKLGNAQKETRELVALVRNKRLHTIDK